MIFLIVNFDIMKRYFSITFVMNRKRVVAYICYSAPADLCYTEVITNVKQFLHMFYGIKNLCLKPSIESLYNAGVMRFNISQ